jgi:protocatechuate 3,4-dioxygenase beta subunit
MNRLGHLRREFLENCIVRGLLVASAPVSANRLFAMWQQAEAAARKPTPAEVLGPFFKKNAPDNRNMRIAGDAGMPLKIAGKIINTRGDAVPGARIDMWHADSKGIYDVHGYRYRTKLAIDSGTDYAVETIMPGHYPDRPAQHVHYLITGPGHKPLITQLYFATDPFFEGDPDKNHGKRGVVSHRESIRPVTLLDEASAPRAAVTFDLILERA